MPENTKRKLPSDHPDYPCVCGGVKYWYKKPGSHPAYRCDDCHALRTGRDYVMKQINIHGKEWLDRRIKRATVYLKMLTKIADQSRKE